jgi:CubicO group peptidase (beta-lactamase class C family)
MEVRDEHGSRRGAWRRSLAAVLVLGVMVALALVPAPSGATRAGAPPAPPPPVEQTILDVFSVNASSGAVISGASIPQDLNALKPGYNLARTFKNGSGQMFMLLLNSNTGKAEIAKVEPDGNLAIPRVWITDNDFIKEWRCTSAELVRTNGVTYLITHDSFMGRIRTCRMNEDGTPDLGSMNVAELDDWKDKNLFNIYYNNGTYYLLGYDTWTGAVVIYSINGQKIASTTWTRGWTSVDHLTIGGVVYRALYKAAGDPQKKPGESGDQLGRFIIQKVAANGVEGENLCDVPTGPNYSAVRFVPLANGQGGWKYGLFFYQRATGSYVMAAFNTQSGMDGVLFGGQIIDHKGDLQPYIEVEPYTFNNQTYLAFLNAENMKPFNYDQAEQMGQVIHDELINKTVGYQFVLAQSGRVIYSRFWGKSRLSDIPSEQTNMTARTPLNIGSASKMITTATVLKLTEGYNGKHVNLNGPISVHIDPEKYNIDQLHPWVKQRTVRNLLMHTTGISAEAMGDCDNEGEYKQNCKNFFTVEPDLDYDAENKVGERSYNNANFSAARQVIEYVTGTNTTEGLKNKTDELWAASVGLTNMTPAFDKDIFYFGPCNEAPDCYQYGGRNWRRGQSELEWSEYGGSGGWSASARDMVEFLGALRYRKFLSATMTNELLDTTLADISGTAGSTALGWDSPWSPGGSEPKQLAKNGAWGDSWGFRAYITRLPNNCDAVIIVNTAVSQHPASLLRDAYKYATGLSNTPPVYYDIAPHGTADGETVNQVAVSTQRVSSVSSEHVVAARDGIGSLKLYAYQVAQDTGVATLVDQKIANTGNLYNFIGAQKVAITDGQAFASASLNPQGQLNLVGWTFNGTDLKQHGLAIGPVGSEVAVTKAAGQGITGRLVTAIRNQAGKLQLHAWLFDHFNNTITLTDSYTAESVTGVTIKTLRQAMDLNQPARVVTAARNSGNGKLQLDVWDVDGTGKLQRRGQRFAFSVNGSTGLPHRIALDSNGDSQSEFFDGTGFLSASINDDGKMEILSWQVTPTGTFVLKDSDSTNTAGLIVDVAIAGTTTAIRRSDNGKLSLIKWEVDSEGKITRASDQDTDTEITRVATAGNLVTALQLETGKLRFVNWKVTD